MRARSSRISNRNTLDAVLLCAGRGTRLRPLTDSIPKALVEIGGQPLVDLHLGTLADAGVRRVVVVVGYRAEQVMDHVGGGSQFGIDVTYALQDPPRGTGDALIQALPEVRTRDFLVGYGDVVFDPLTNIWRELSRDRVPKIIAARVANAGSFGRLVTEDREGLTLLRAIREKDGQSTPGLINAGAYLLNSEIAALLKRLSVSPRGEIELTDALTRYARGPGKVSVLTVGKWVDVGSWGSVQLANELVGVNSARTYNRRAELP